MTDVLYHYVHALQSHPAFEAYQGDLKARFDYLVDRLLDLPPEASKGEMKTRIGELRGLREALRTPERIARENEE